VAFIVLIGVLVTVHELGHFLVAKAFNVQVLRFSVGFGPPIVSFKRGETEYQIAWIPLGGYVKMGGMEAFDEVSPEDAPRSFLAQAPWKRALIVLAGPAFNLLFPMLILFFANMGPQEFSAPRLGYVEPDRPAYQAGLRTGDVVTAVDGVKVRSFDEFAGLVVDSETPITIEVLRGTTAVSVSVTPQIITSSTPLGKSSRATIGVQADARPPIIGVATGSSAQAAGLQTFDRILAVDAAPIPDEVELDRVLGEVPEGKVLAVKVVRSSWNEVGGTALARPELVTVSVTRQAGSGYAALGAEPGDLYVWTVASGGAAQKMGLRRGDRLVKVGDRAPRSWRGVTLELEGRDGSPFELVYRHGAEEKSLTAAMAKVTIDDEFKNRFEVYQFGAWPRPAYLDSRGDPLGRGSPAAKVMLSLGPKEAARFAIKTVPRLIAQTASALAGIFTGRVPSESLGGPIMLFQVAQKSAEIGVGKFVEMMALISINLGLVNLLPIPVLDGFSLLAALWEAVRRRPIPMRFREYANRVGLAMLAVLMVMVFKNDITKLFR
jgi:regulator of sigma E protease